VESGDDGCPALDRAEQGVSRASSFRPFFWSANTRVTKKARPDAVMMRRRLSRKMTCWTQSFFVLPGVGVSQYSQARHAKKNEPPKRSAA
jgi:hypothetical protein